MWFTTWFIVFADMSDFAKIKPQRSEYQVGIYQVGIYLCRAMLYRPIGMRRYILIGFNRYCYHGLWWYRKTMTISGVLHARRRVNSVARPIRLNWRILTVRVINYVVFDRQNFYFFSHKYDVLTRLEKISKFKVILWNDFERKCICSAWLRAR